MKIPILLLSMLLAVLPFAAAAQADEASTSEEAAASNETTTSEETTPSAETTSTTETAVSAETAATDEAQADNDAGDTRSTAERKTSADPSAHVSRAMFTTEVVDHEPVDELKTLPEDTGRVYFFTEIVDMAGEVITHRWLLDGKTIAEVPIEIGGPRWRVYSFKTLPSNTTGTWSVEVVDADGAVMFETELVPSTEMSEADANESTTTASR